MFFQDTPRQAIIWTRTTRKKTLRVRVSYVHAREACESGQARVDPLERDEIDDGSVHRQKQEINSLYRQEAMFFACFALKFCWVHVPQLTALLSWRKMMEGRLPVSRQSFNSYLTPYILHLIVAPYEVWTCFSPTLHPALPCLHDALENTHYCTILCFYDNTLQMIYTRVCSG